MKTLHLKGINCKRHGWSFLYRKNVTLDKTKVNCIDCLVLMAEIEAIPKDDKGRPTFRCAKIEVDRRYHVVPRGETHYHAVFHCPVCGNNHTHGWGSGHRCAHCGSDVLNTFENGYFLDCDDGTPGTGRCPAMPGKKEG